MDFVMRDIGDTGKPGIALAVDLSATPFYIKGSNHPEGQPFPWLVSDFGLVDAIESGIVKIPRLPVLDTTGRPDPKYFRLWERIREDLQPGEFLPGRARKPKPEAIWREAEDALRQMAGQWSQRFELVQAAKARQEVVPPVLIIVCDNTDIAEVFFRKISGESEEDSLTEEEVKAVLSDSGDDESEAEETGTRSRSKKPKKRISYGPSAISEMFANTPTKRDKMRAIAVAGLTGIGPKDALEGMIAAQMLAIHDAAMACFRYALAANKSSGLFRDFLGQAGKLCRTFAVLLDALNHHRGKGLPACGSSKRSRSIARHG